LFGSKHRSSSSPPSSRSRVVDGRVKRLNGSSFWLSDLAVSEKTADDYRRSVMALVLWMNSSGMVVRKYSDWDLILFYYLHDLFEDYGHDGSGYGRAIKTYFGLLHMLPMLSHNLPMSWRALKGWNRVRTVDSYPPLTWEVTCAIAFSLSKIQDKWLYGIGVLVAFHCLLRVSSYVGY